jgi:hypothetical protein
MPINLCPTNWIDTKITSGQIGLIEVPSLNQEQSIRQPGLIVDNCGYHGRTTTARRRFTVLESRQLVRLPPYDSHTAFANTVC